MIMTIYPFLGLPTGKPPMLNQVLHKIMPSAITEGFVELRVFKQVVS
jgi:branched-subunit amino acid transport protein AzlD